MTKPPLEWRVDYCAYLEQLTTEEIIDLWKLNVGHAATVRWGQKERFRVNPEREDRRHMMEQELLSRGRRVPTGVS